MRKCCFFIFLWLPLLVNAQIPSIDYGKKINSTLTPSDPKRNAGSHFKTYSFQGKSGQSVTLLLESVEIDPFMVLTFPSGRQMENDDISTQDHNAQIKAVLSENGVYYITATTYDASKFGNFTLSVSLPQTTAPLPPPPVSKPKPRSRSSAPRPEPVPPIPSPSVPPSAPPPVPQSPHIFGLFVGISNYGSRAPHLDFTANDAHIVRNALIDAGMRPQDGIVLTDQFATVQDFQRAINQIAHEITPNDVFVFFFSGHGDRKIRKTRQNADPDGYDETVELFDESVLDDELDILLGGIQAKMQLIVVDACFSGGLAKEVVSKPNRMGLFSSDEDLESNVAAQFKAGGFLSKFFSDGVRSKKADLDKNGQITALELSQYIHERYRDEVRDPRNRDGSINRVFSYQHLVVDRGGIAPQTIIFGW